MKRKQKITSNNRRLVVYIHSYLVLRRRWNTLQFCVLQRPLWSRQCGKKKKKTAVNHQAQWVLCRGRIRRKKGLCSLKKLPKSDIQVWSKYFFSGLPFGASAAGGPVSRSSDSERTAALAVHYVTGSKAAAASVSHLLEFWCWTLLFPARLYSKETNDQTPKLLLLFFFFLPVKRGFPTTTLFPTFNQWKGETKTKTTLCHLSSDLPMMHLYLWWCSMR